MHIDLNSCFATIEQQANPHLRGKPIAVAAYATDGGCILAPSIEAKQFGVKTGMRVAEGKTRCPQLIVMTGDPPKYRDVHQKFKTIFESYSPSITPKSIDEAIIDFHPMVNTFTQPPIKQLLNYAHQIKHRLRSEVGEWISCNIGIAPNRFLAKLAASLHKPDGLDCIDHTNLLDILQTVTLLDLTGINLRNQARLHRWGITTPLQFFYAPEPLLRRQVFGSVLGHYWHLRLHGYETDRIDFQRRTYGQSYALSHHTDDSKQLNRFFLKLTEKMGRRLRRAGHTARGIQVYLSHRNGTSWHKAQTFPSRMHTTRQLYQSLQIVLDQKPHRQLITKIAVSCFHLQPYQDHQLPLFADLPETKWHQLSQASDAINDKYGEFTLTPTTLMTMQDTIVDRIAFGNVKEILNLYE